MADKNGNPQQCRNARFSNRPMANPGVCPFKGPDIAIVPMRYALDRSRYDVDPGRLTPLSAEGKWKCPSKTAKPQLHLATAARWFCVCLRRDGRSAS